MWSGSSAHRDSRVGNAYHVWLLLSVGSGQMLVPVSRRDLTTFSHSEVCVKPQPCSGLYAKPASTKPALPSALGRAVGASAWELEEVPETRALLPAVWCRALSPRRRSWCRHTAVRGGVAQGRHSLSAAPGCALSSDEPSAESDQGSGRESGSAGLRVWR